MAKEKEKKAKKGKDGAGAGPPAITLAGTPRAAGSVRRIKSRAGLAGFALAAYVAWRSGLPPTEVALRALAGGIVTYLAGWWAAVAAWRHILRARTRVEVEAARRRAAEAAGADS